MVIAICGSRGGSDLAPVVAGAEVDLSPQDVHDGDEMRTALGSAVATGRRVVSDQLVTFLFSRTEHLQGGAAAPRRRSETRSPVEVVEKYGRRGGTRDARRPRARGGSTA